MISGSSHRLNQTMPNVHAPRWCTFDGRNQIFE